jgi:TrmH family RNA methyltransferase
MPAITSRRNPAVARCRAVAWGEIGELVLLDGVHLVSEALAAGIPLRQVFAAPTSRGHELQSVLQRLTDARVEVVPMAGTVMDAISPLRSASRIVALAPRPVHTVDALYRAPAPLVLIASDVQDPGNLGAIVRVAEAAGAAGVLAAGRSADPFGWKALRGSMGSALRIPIVRQIDTLAAARDARRRGCRLLATAPAGGRSPWETDLRAAAAVLIGGEGAGLAAEVLEAADDLLTIPMAEPVESLNAALTAGVIAYEARRQRLLS